ncbi:Cullin-2 [Eumeta japonica]|uniref:Cullin-2 n=1 Tax=Eumeta variegata TaxID=151549 RepID=A0A4C1SV10_EUMVA|nr:Cullin-2 [Eumeta japonica]
MRRVVCLQSVDRAVWGRSFSLVYSLCVAQPEPLGDRLYSETRGFVEEHVRGLLRRVAASDTVPLGDPDDGLLARYADAWAEFRQGAVNLNNMFSYLNLQFVNQHKPTDAEIMYGSAASVEGGEIGEEEAGAERIAGEDSRRLEVGELCLAAWERLLLRPLAQQLTARLVAALSEARWNPPPLDSERSRLLRALISSAVEARAARAEPLALYEEVALRPYLEAASCDHERAACELLADGDVSHYMRHALEGLHRELRLADAFLHPSSKDAVRSCYESAAVAPHLLALHAHAEPLLQAAAASTGTDAAERRDDLRRLYALLRPLGPNALRPLVDAAHAHVVREGTAMLGRTVADDAHTHFVESVLALQRKYARLFADVFDGDQAFFAALDRACSVCVNARPEPHLPPRAPDLLSRYCDSLLRKRPPGAGNPQLTEAEAEEKLSAAIIVFKYVDDKDYFQKYYARALAKRLIQQASASMEQEEAMINRLKAACGYEFTNKLHRMFTDVALSADLNAKFQWHVRNEANAADSGAAHLYVQVLQAGAWPLAGAHAQHGATHPPPLPLPAPLERPARLFEQFYRASFNGRRLAWLQHLCTGELRTRYTPRFYHITATATQCALLLSFDTVDEWNARELRDSLQLSQEAWLRALRPAVDSGLLILIGDADPPESQTEEARATLRLNTAFSSKRTKLRLACAPPAAGATAATGTSTAATTAVADCDDDRKMFLQAAIVRVMKRRKVCAHNELLQEVLVAARGLFSPSVALIKKCIEALIDKQYLERAPAQHDTYNYLA